jgi:hypothetical protein
MGFNWKDILTYSNPITASFSLLGDAFGGDGDSEAATVPASESAGQSYGSFLQEYLKYAPERKSAETSDLDTQMALAQQLAPQLLALQEQYGKQYNEQMLALERDLAPSQLATQKAQLANAAELAPLIRSISEDPQTAGIRAELGRQLEAELRQGAELDPEIRRELEQSVRSGQSARGMIRGNAPLRAEALVKGSAADQMRKSRQQAAQSFLQGQQAMQINPFTLTRDPVNYTAPTTNYAGLGSTLTSMVGTQNQAAQQTQMLNFNANQLAQSNKPDWMGLIGNVAGSALGAYLGK